MVRGSMLELMDHTFDGHEDSLSGDLRGGLGQLVDGVYGWDNFKAAGINGHVKGEFYKFWSSATSPSINYEIVFSFYGTGVTKVQCYAQYSAIVFLTLKLFCH